MPRLKIALVCALLFVTCACAAAGRYPDDRFVDAANAVRPSVVLLTMKVPPEKKADKYDDEYATGLVVASGAWGADILSVSHAVEGAWDIVATVGNKKRAGAHVIARDKELDIALLRTKQTGLRVLPLGSSADLTSQLGREVALVGYPIPDEFEDEDLGLAASLNSGHLSSLRKHALEVSLPIVPGESGAPIFLIDTGAVIGIAESRFDDEHSIGFALPIDDAKAFLHKHDAGHGF
jgi:serine protease Do